MRERTFELEQINRELQKEIAERKTAEKERSRLAAAIHQTAETVHCLLN
ncbi:MAG: hypothetical protein GY866_20740 [Proteobacteria bacterium]|nr:hypothetical protein [Pseudomonadota bacterium]